MFQRMPPFLFAPFFFGFALHGRCICVLHFEPIGGATGNVSPAACCLLPAACCLLPAACCLLPAACCLLPAAVLSIVRRAVIPVVADISFCRLSRHGQDCSKHHRENAEQGVAGLAHSPLHWIQSAVCGSLRSGR